MSRPRLLICLLASGMAGSVCGGTPALSPAKRYTLIGESWFLDDCPICDRISRPVPMWGSFDLRLLAENPLQATFALEHVEFTAGSAEGRRYRVTGQGTYAVGGAVARVQTLQLQVMVDDGVTNHPATFTHTSATGDRLWPMLLATAIQVDGTPVQQYQFQLAAAPFQELWFSPATGFTPAKGLGLPSRVLDGDWISTAGRVIRDQHELTAGLGIMPVVPNLGLDAVAVLPGGEVVFSTIRSAFSEVLGPMSGGDLLSVSGRIYRRQAEFTAAFRPTQPGDFGLDAVQVLPTGEWLFSTETDFVSGQLAKTIRSGDLLSERGAVVKSNAELLSRFVPTHPETDYGLKAFHRWSSGEVWFSVASSFQSADGVTHSPGDLLSDRGYVVFANRDLVSGFQPMEDRSDFGLTALWIVTDEGWELPAPEPGIAGSEPGVVGTRLRWAGTGRVWEVQAAASVSGPWSERGFFTFEPQFSEETPTAGIRFYRLRQY